MSDKAYSVSLIGPEEADALLRRFKKGPARSNVRTLVLASGLELVGEFSLQARDVESKEIEWEHSEKNLITDLGRRFWMDQHWNNAYVGFAPSIEPPHIGRYSIGTDVNQVVATNVAPTNNPATHTKSFSTTYGVPGTNRTLGMIALSYSGQNAVVTNVGLGYLISYALLTPPKTQTTTQTLEVVYKVSMNPIA